MIGSSNFSAFYGNDLTPTTNYSNVSVDQLGEPTVKATSGSNFTQITTDKIPVKITFIEELTTISYAQEKELSDTTDATTLVSSGDIIYVRQGKRLTLTLENDGVAAPPVTIVYTLTNNLTNATIATVSLNLYSSVV